MRLVATRVSLLAVALCLMWGCMQVSAQDIDPDFKPEFLGVEFTSREVRPGDLFGMTLKFRNTGTKPAAADYTVFVHFEAPEATCENIVFQADHEPSEPTSTWQPGEVILDGPRVLVAPADKPEQEYFVHVGIYDWHGSGRRFLSTYDAGKITVTSEAAPSESLAPEALSAEELERRRRALRMRIPPDRAASLEADGWRFDLDRHSGAWALTDKRAGVLWGSDPARPRFGEVVLRNGDRSFVWRVDRFDEIAEDGDGLTLVTRPTIEGRPSGATVTFHIEPVTDPDGIKLRYESEATGDWQVARVRPLHDALWITESDEGVAYVPHRLGIEFPADEGLPGEQSWTTYNNLTMAMFGAVRDGAALLVNWDNVSARLTLDTTWPDLPLVPGRRMRALSLDIPAPEGSCTLHPLGRGGYVEIAHAYRPLARAKGWRRTWADKRKQFPSVDRMFGAANFKPFVLSRVLPSSRFCHDGRERVYLGFTFDEVAQCAEHWRNDLDIDRAGVIMAGWIEGGYDVRHPDILPAAPECGGNDGLKDAFERIKRCGFLVGMHDNYQDMYEDAASWSEDWLNKNAAGVPKMGGNWNGGQAWQVCAIKQVELAARKDTNLPKVAELFGPTIYFIDTVFAWPLVTCEDPAHPMTRRDDLEWKTKLCMLAKEHFGMFGSEEGREWSVPCADYLEGIFGHQTDSAPGAVIPLFPLVYSDCVQIMTHQGNRVGPGHEKKMADHILFAEMHLPQFGNHLYWDEPRKHALPVAPLAPIITDLGERKFEITYRWKVSGEVQEDYRVFVHFSHSAATRAGGIAYQDDHAPGLPTSQWQPGTIVQDGPHIVEVPPEFGGPSEVLLGMTRDGARVRLADLAHDDLRYDVGTISVRAEGISLEPSDIGERAEIWACADGGWAEALCPTDRVIKNTFEVLSPLNLITAEIPMTSHEFLTQDRLVQRTRFGDLTITVAYEKPAQVDGNALPAYGFVVESPTFIAFCATRYNGIEYDAPALFTARSLDGKPIAESSRVRIYHGFGDSRISLAGRVFEVAREEVVIVRE